MENAPTTPIGSHRLRQLVSQATQWRQAPATVTRPAPAAPGAYGLVLFLERKIVLRGGRGNLPKGAYVYAGSAYGPGGMGARLARHLGRPKTLHWHIDQLTAIATEKLGFPAPGGNECDIIQRLLDTGEFDVPIAKFGATDCRTCTSHLLAWRG
ncbi:MAG: GIY-YIG nuclease family protein [Alphaproteobacteria bacterium]